MTVVAVFHDLNLAAEFCDRLVLLDHGRVAGAGTPAEVLTAEMILNVYGARVFVGRNPVSNAPHVILAAKGHSGLEAEEHWRLFAVMAPDSPWAAEARARLGG